MKVRLVEAGSPCRAERRKRKELTEDQKHEIKEAFELFDTDKDKEIDYHELKVRTSDPTSVPFKQVHASLQHKCYHN